MLNTKYDPQNQEMNIKNHVQHSNLGWFTKNTSLTLVSFSSTAYCLQASGLFCCRIRHPESHPDGNITQLVNTYVLHKIHGKKKFKMFQNFNKSSSRRVCVLFVGTYFVATLIDEDSKWGVHLKCRGVLVHWSNLSSSLENQLPIAWWAAEKGSSCWHLHSDNCWQEDIRSRKKKPAFKESTTATWMKPHAAIRPLSFTRWWRTLMNWCRGQMSSATKRERSFSVMRGYTGSKIAQTTSKFTRFMQSSLPNIHIDCSRIIVLFQVI